MQIKSLKVQDYKCLCDFDINFSTNDSGSSTILIGENGTGKTTTLEAILNIMASFDSPKIEKDLASDYELVYEFGGETICITKSNHRYKIIVDNEIRCTGRINEIKKYLKNKKIFPQRIIRNLTKEIGSLPMSYNSIDFLYDDFIRVFKNTELYSKEYLSYDDIQERRKKIEEIISALYEGQV